jgi:hypothetical protein
MSLYKKIPKSILAHATFALLSLSAIAQTNPQVAPNPSYTLLEKPALPLLGIIRFRESQSYPGMDPYPKSEELPIIAKMYKGLHVTGGEEMAQSSPLWRKLRENNPAFMILPYFQSTLTAVDGLDAKATEADPLNLISMYLEGKIEAPLTHQTTKFKIALATEKRGFGIKASTTESDFSKNTAEYIIILRVGDEIMKVVGVDKSTNEVTVVRGYKNTQAKDHPAGSNVFAPVYRGKKSKGGDKFGSSSNYPDYTEKGEKTPISYHLRLDSTEIINTLAATGADYIKKGASGLWLDLTSPGIFCPSNAYGDKVTPWNFELNAAYTSTTYLNHQDLKCQNLREKIKQLTGITPQIVANNNAAGKYFEQGGGGMNLVRPTQQKPVPIEGVVLEAAFCFYQTQEWFDLEQWTANLSTLIHGSQNKYPVWPWIKNVKYAELPMTRNVDAERFQFFDYTSTLLGYEENAGVVCPLPLHWVNNKGERSLNLPEYFFYDIGTPSERVAYNEINKMRIPGKNSYMRNWSKAIVVVNPSESNDSDISIPAGYLDPATNQEIRLLSMAAHTGKILLKKN